MNNYRKINIEDLKAAREMVREAKTPDQTVKAVIDAIGNNPDTVKAILYLLGYTETGNKL